MPTPAAALTLHRITKDRYDWAAEVVVPVHWLKHGFLLGEPMAHRACAVTGRVASTYRGFVCRLDHAGNAIHYELSAPVTIPEWERLDPGSLAEQVTA